MRFSSTIRSDVVRPGDNTLVLSDIISVTPSLFTASNAERSKICEQSAALAYRLTHYHVVGQTGTGSTTALCKG